MSSNYKPFHDDDGDGHDQQDSLGNNASKDTLHSSTDSKKREEMARDVELSVNTFGRFPLSLSPNSAESGSSSSSGSGTNPLLSLTKKKKKKPLPKIESSGVVNYGGIGFGQNSDSEHEDDSSTVSNDSNMPLGYALPFQMNSGFPSTQLNNDIDDDELSQRTPIPKVPPNDGIAAILPSDFLRNRTHSEANVSDISDDDSVVRRQKKEEENVGRLVSTAKQQHHFAQAWFSVGQTQNALPPIPPKNRIPSNAPPGVKRTKIIDPKASSGPIDLDSGEVWKTNEDDKGEGEDDSKKNYEVGSFNFGTGTFHSAPTRKRENKKKIFKFGGVPEDEDLTTYYIENNCLDKIACTLGETKCTFLALFVVVTFFLLLASGAITAGVFLSQQGDITKAPSAYPSASPTISHKPTISSMPSSLPTESPTMTPSLAPSGYPSSKPSLRPSAKPSQIPSRLPSSQPSSPPTSMPSSIPTDIPSAYPSSQPSLSSQPSSFPSDKPSTCFSSVLYGLIGDTQQVDGFNDKNGFSVSLSADGTIVAISALFYPDFNGSVAVYEQISDGNQDTEWVQKGQRILQAEYFGNSVELSDDGLTVIIGNSIADDSGFAKVFQFTNTDTWEQLGSDIVEDDSALAGHTVAISGDGLVIAVGDPDYDGGVGRVHVYEYDEVVSDWRIRGDSINGLSSLGEFGYSVSLSTNGNIVACGAPRGGTASFSIAGSVRILKWDSINSEWVVLGDELKSPESITARFGNAISISGDETLPRIAIGSTDSKVDNKLRSGRVSVFEYNNGPKVWGKIGEDMIGTPIEGQKFGYAVSISGDGNHVAVGAPLSNNGQTYVYFWNGYTWVGTDPLSGTDPTSGFGSSVDLSKDGTTLAIGAPSEFSPGYSEVYNSNKACDY
jgi:hypothetical protein